MPERVMWRKGGKLQENDEGYYYEQCSACRRQTEHEVGECLRCANQKLENKKSKPVWLNEFKDAINNLE